MEEKNSLPSRRWRKGEKSTAREVYDTYEEAKNSRRTSCYWDLGASESGGDWVKRWDLQEKLWNMWFKAPDKDDFRANVKSPMTFGRVETIMQKLRRVEWGFDVQPGEESDKKNARIAQILMDNWVDRQGVKHQIFTWEKDALIHGSGFAQVYYLKKSRDARFFQTDAGAMSKKEKRLLREGGRVYKKDKVVDYDGDVILAPVKINELYWDPAARCVHGPEYAAQFVYRRMLPSYSQCMSMFKNDPDARNLERIRPVSAYESVDDLEFFEPPHDAGGGEYVELLHYFNVADDRYVVLANDVVIKDIPLPYNHKRIPIVKIDAIEYPHQFYGMGIPDVLLNPQSMCETLQNIEYDRLQITAHPVLKVRMGLYGEFSKQYQTIEPNMMVPVYNQDDVQQLEYAPVTFDLFRALEFLERNASITTQIDPTQMGITQKYVPATGTMAMKELSETALNNLIESFSRGIAEVGYQFYELRKQFDTVPKIKDEVGKKKLYRTEYLHNIKIDPETFRVIDSGAGAESFLEIKPEYFETRAKLDIAINPNTMKPISQAVETQKSQATIAQLAPFMVDPSNKETMMQHPQGWIDGPGMLKWYAETNGVPTTLLVKPGEDEEVSVKRAEEQGKIMMKGEALPGLPGEPDIHKSVHVHQLHAQNKKVDKLMQKIGELGPLAEVYGPMLPEMKEVEKEKELAMKLAEHLKDDDMPRQVAESAVVDATQQRFAPPQVPMPPGLTPQGDSPMPVPMGGNQMAGMLGEPTLGGAGGNVGRPPLFDAGI